MSLPTAELLSLYRCYIAKITDAGIVVAGTVANHRGRSVRGVSCAFRIQDGRSDAAGSIRRPGPKSQGSSAKAGVIICRCVAEE